MKNLLTIFLVATIVVSCGKKTGNSQIKMSFFKGSSNMLAGANPMFGGIVVVGHRVDGTGQFQIGLQNANDEQVVNLQKGLWEFAAVGWDGTGTIDSQIFTGVNRCAYTGPVDLSTDNSSITFTMLPENCGVNGIPNHPGAISNSSFLTTEASTIVNQFLPVTLQSCSGLTVGTPGMTPGCTSTPTGLTRSFKIVANGVHKELGFSNPLPVIESSCYTPIITGSLATNLKIPVGTYTTKSETLMDVKILAYQTEGCTDLPITISANDNLYTGFNQGTIKAKAHSTGVNNTIYIEHNASTVSANIGYKPFGYGQDGVKTNPTQTIGEYGFITGIDSVNPQITLALGTGYGISLND
jgi:hypothetical protein